MNVVAYSENRVAKMQDFGAERLVTYNEGTIFVFEDRNGDKKVFKRFHITEGPFASNKLATLNSLQSLAPKIGITELVIPEKLVSVKGHIEGVVMPFIEGPTLDEILKDPTIDINFKSSCLMKIGNILSQMKKARERLNIKFFLNDLHEENFIFNDEEGLLQVIDLDSCSIIDNYPFKSRYLTMEGLIKKFPNKYIKNPNQMYGGKIIPNENTDLYCYAIVVLNFLSGSKVQFWLQDEFDAYLDYLKELGAPIELIDAFSKIYSNNPNVNFGDSLESIPYFYGNSSRDKFLKRVREKYN